jgi:hypothetical protein
VGPGCDEVSDMKPAHGAGCTALERRVSIISGFTEFQQLFGYL